MVNEDEEDEKGKNDHLHRYDQEDNQNTMYDKSIFVGLFDDLMLINKKLKEKQEAKGKRDLLKVSIERINNVAQKAFQERKVFEKDDHVEDLKFLFRYCHEKKQRLLQIEEK